MEPYQKMYTFLFNKVTDALNELEKPNVYNTKEILVRVQIQAEAIYLEAKSNESLSQGTDD